MHIVHGMRVHTRHSVGSCVETCMDTWIADSDIYRSHISVLHLHIQVLIHHLKIDSFNVYENIKTYLYSRLYHVFPHAWCIPW